MSGSPLTNFNLQDSATSIRKRIQKLQEESFLRRLWEQDPRLWDEDVAEAPHIRSRLGWLGVPRAMQKELPRLDSLAESLRQQSCSDVVVLGMGGSSLCPEVFRLSFPPRHGWPRLQVLDSTDPGAILRLETSLDLGRTFFIVSSKSGTTTETLCFHRYFADRLGKLGVEGPGGHFAAITDPGTPLETLGRREGFREVFLNPPEIGGRYSALSFFGLVPAALAGVDVSSLLLRAKGMVSASSAEIPAWDSPGVELGAVIGEMALAGRDKLTLFASPPVASFGLWAEQLLAESTGKEGKGVIPVAGEPIGRPEQYGRDRLFVGLFLTGGDQQIEERLKALEGAGHPVVRLRMSDPLDLGAEFYRWEVATAVAGSILEINPFDEPNVQESKDNTRNLLEEFRKTGSFRGGVPAERGGDLTIFDSGVDSDLEETLRVLLQKIRPGDYFGIQAYLAQGDGSDLLLGRIRVAVRDRLRVATTLGYGPRYLHSTGQLHKGGPSSGVFLQITAEDKTDLAIPGGPYGFSTLKTAQALGDLRSLQRHNRRALRVHLEDSGAGLERLAGLAERVVASL